MNKHIADLANQSYSQAFEKCKLVEHKIGNVDALFTGFAMNAMYSLVVKDCIQYLNNAGYADAADSLKKEKHVTG